MNYGRALKYLLVFSTLISSTSTSTRDKDKTEIKVDKQQKEGHQVVGTVNHQEVFEENRKQMPSVGEEQKEVVVENRPSFKKLPSCSSQQHKKNKQADAKYDEMDTEERFQDAVDEEGNDDDNRRPLVATSSASSANNNLSSARHFLVSTLDGKLTLLDQTGKEIWSLHTGELFSSTISSLQLSENGKWVNLIPSLTGGLYKYDEESLLPMPMNVDSLLHKSFKLSNDVVINGGKELRTLGIDLNTGRLRYDCGISGCITPQLNELEEVGTEPVTLVVKKQLQTVRAVDTLSGSEKWNFSVGMHEMGLTGVVDGCMQEENDGDHSVQRGALGFVKVVIPEGRLLSADPLSKTVWDYKFTSPIAQAWLLENGRLTYVDPVLNTPLKEGPLALYVGKHNSQFYVQESRPLTHKLEKLMGYPILKPMDKDINKPPKIAWRPSFLINEDSSDSSEETALSPLNGVRPSMRPFYVLEHDEIISTPLVEDDSDVEYVDASTSTPDHATTLQTQEIINVNGNPDEDESLFNDVIPQVIIASLWVWWKEVLGISLFTAVLLNVILMGPLMRHFRMRNIRRIRRFFINLWNRDQQEGQIIVPLLPSPNLDLLPISGSSDSTSNGIMEFGSGAGHGHVPRPRTISDSFSSGFGVEFPEIIEIPYMSQYLKEFEPVQCLGKGGFGVVFEARKKIDDRNYAVKRISLPNREEARVRVMREVKALAQLDHRNIVRYFNAWIENPPNGWLEKNDPLWNNCKIGSMGSPTAEEAVSDFPTSATSQSEEHHGGAHKLTNRSRKHTLKALGDFDVSAPLLEEEDTSYIIFDENAEIPSRRIDDDDEFPAKVDEDESFLEMLSKRGTETTIDVSSDLSTSQGGGFWKKPNANSVSWNDASSINENISQCNNNSFSLLSPASKSRIVFESEVGGGGENDVEVGEEAHEIENVSVMYLYIQQELCQKRTLREWLRAEKTREIRTVINFFSQIVDAVEYVHSKKLIHRDLKPSNIFLAGNSEGGEHVLKIGDFGLATTVVNQGLGLLSIEDNKKTRNGEKQQNNLTSQVGTQLYMSPEQSKRKPYDYKVDIYSLGLIFFELLVPFHTEMERHDVLSKVRKVQIPFEFKDAYPEEHSVITQMISTNPHQRPDATSITLWVKSHLRNVVESVEGGGEDGLPSSDKNTHRSNSSPASISLSRAGSLSNSCNDSNSRTDTNNPFLLRKSIGGGDADRKFQKSHSFTSL